MVVVVVVVVGAGLDARVDVVVPAAAVVGDTADVVDVARPRWSAMWSTLRVTVVVVVAAAHTGVGDRVGVEGDGPVAGEEPSGDRRAGRSR